MIKSLFETDEPQQQQSEEIKIEREENAADEPTTAEKIAEPPPSLLLPPQYIEVNEAENLFDLPEETTFENPDEAEKPLTPEELESLDSFVATTTATDAAPQFSNSLPETPENSFTEAAGEVKDSSDRSFDLSELPFAEVKSETENFAPPVEAVNEIENFAPSDSELIADLDEVPTENFSAGAETVNFELPGERKSDEETKPVYSGGGTLFQAPDEPESFAETARRSGLAYAAAITLTASIVFMLVIGWFADLLFGSSPWGIVGGIVLGSIIGFVQFFRMTAQIFKK